MKPKYKTKFKSNRSADLILKRAKMLKRKRLSTARKKKFKSRVIYRVISLSISFN